MDADLGTRARIPADIDTPDKLLYGLTARQVAILSAATGVCYLIWQTIGGQVPLPVVAGIVIPTLGVAVVVALGRRDGLPLDGWLRAAVSYHRAPRRAVPAPSEMAAVPAWAPEHTDTHPGPRPVALRLPAHAINRDGVLDLGERAAVMVATGTVNLGLRTGGQAALIGGYAGWLHSLTGPVQVAVSTRRVDLASRALRVVEAADRLPHPALADAAFDYAGFLTGIAADRDPLGRTVTIVCTATGQGIAGVEAMRRAEHTAAALAPLGVATRVLDGPTALAALSSAVDPYQDADPSWGRALPQNPVTGPAMPAEWS